MAICNMRIFAGKNGMRGGALVELLLCVAIAAVAIPFLFRYQMRAARRAENIAIASQMSELSATLERYMTDNRDEFLRTVGRNITRVNLSDLVPYGVPDEFARDNADRYQMRILKNGTGNTATLQGIVIMSAADITPQRTREIAAAGNMGVVDGARTYDVFSTWRTPSADIGVRDASIVATTDVRRGTDLYLWRVPSENAADATMSSALNLGGHDIVNTTFVNTDAATFDETLSLGVASAGTLTFHNRTTIDAVYETASATVSGTLSADSRTMEIANKLSLDDVAKFSSFSTGDLWATNLRLAGLSVSAVDENDNTVPSLLKINQALDMTRGRIDAMFVTVGFDGSITPRLVVRDRIEDSSNPSYFWDAYAGVANFVDVILDDLGRMASLAVTSDGGDTSSARTFSAVTTNKNATASDYMIAIEKIASAVRAKYRMLNLE